MWPEAKHKWQSFKTFTISHRSSGVFLANKSQLIRRCLPLQQGQGFEAWRLVANVEMWFDGSDLVFEDKLGSLPFGPLLSSGFLFAVKM